MQIVVAAPGHDGAVMSAGPGEVRLDMSPGGESRPTPRHRVRVRVPASCSIATARSSLTTATWARSTGSNSSTGPPEAIARFNRAGIPVAVVTNQAGVARGLYGIDDVARVHQHIAEHLAEHGAHIDLFLYCPYHPDGVVEAFARTSEDRKPRPGMAKAAEAALNLDLTASWVVGDRPEDIGLAEAVGASAIYLGPDALRAPGGLVVPEPGCRGPVHPGAHRGMSTVYDLQTLAPSADGSPAKFPAAPYASAASYFGAYAEEIARAASSIEPAALDRAAAILLDAYTRGARCSPAATAARPSIANHLQCDHLKGIRTTTDLAPRV